MGKMRTALGAGVAAIAAIGFCGMAVAQSPQTHVLTITLPGGGIEQIRYAGAAAPQVYVGDAPTMAMPAMFAAGPPFAEFDRISAAMDRQADQMFREVAALSSAPAQIDPATIAALPAGSQEYSFVSTMSGNGVCSRSVEITSQGNGGAPHVVTHTSGDCTAGAPGLQVPAQLPAAQPPGSGPRMIMTKAKHPAAAPHTVMAKATGARPYAGFIHEASLN